MTLRPPSARSATLAVIAFGLLLVLAANLPGQMSFDSIVQLADGRSGVYHLWHPPIMAWLLGLGDALLPGTALYVAAVATLFFAALAAAVATRPRVSWATPPLVLALCLSPLLLLDQGIVWKDILFANSAVAGFILLTLAAAPARDGADLGLSGAGAVLLFSLAALTRQNGLIMGLFGMIALGRLAWLQRPNVPIRARWRQAGTIAGGGFAAIYLITVVAGLALQTHAADTPGTEGQVRLLKLYDIVGAAKRDPTVDLHLLDPDLVSSLRAAEAVYTPQRVDTVAASAGIGDAVADDPPGLDATWRGMVLGHPAAFFAQRLDVFRWMIAPPRIDRCLPVYTGVDGPLETMKGLGLKPTWRAQDLRLARYAEAFESTPLYTHAVWALLAVGLIIVLLRTREASDTVVALMLAGTLAFTASFLAIGVACDHRYLYALDLATMVALIHVTAGLRLPPWHALRERLGVDGRRPASGGLE